ncbi:MAG: SOS response-associated peptidase [Halioglobus sp.]
MCGRFNVTNTPGLQELVDLLGIDLKLPPPRSNIAPTEDVLLLHDGKGESARWWLTPAWAKDLSQKYSMFNARCESLGSSRAFQRPFKSQRGIVPLSSFIEWRGKAGNKEPWLITNEREALAIAAIWDVWQGEGEPPLLSCALVTTAAAKAFEPWHSRMPVMLTADECDRWMDNDTPVAASDSLFRPDIKFPLCLSPLDKAVGNARNMAPELMQPVGEVVTLV